MRAPPCPDCGIPMEVCFRAIAVGLPVKSDEVAGWRCVGCKAYHPAYKEPKVK